MGNMKDSKYSCMISIDINILLILFYIIEVYIQPMIFESLRSIL